VHLIDFMRGRPQHSSPVRSSPCFSYERSPYLCTLLCCISSCTEISKPNFVETCLIFRRDLHLFVNVNIISYLLWVYVKNILVHVLWPMMCDKQFSVQGAGRVQDLIEGSVMVFAYRNWEKPRNIEWPKIQLAGL